MPLYYKLTQKDGLCWSGLRCIPGLKTEVPTSDWDTMSDFAGEGFGISCCLDPLFWMDFLPPSIYCEIYEVEPSWSRLLIRDGAWRCRSITTIRKIERKDWPMFNSETRRVSTHPDIWVDCEKGMKVFAFDQGKVLARGGLVQAYDNSHVLSFGDATTELHGKATLSALDESHIHQYGKGEVLHSDQCRYQDYR